MNDNAPATGYVWRPWKVAGLAFSAVLVVAGVVTSLAGGGSTSPADEGVPTTAVGPAAPSGRTVDIPGARGFGSSIPPLPGPDAPGGETPAPAAPAESPVDADSPWSPALLRGGLSFLVGFSLAYALRTFVKIAVFFLGVWAASLFLLSSLGWIEVHWTVIDAVFEGWSSRVGSQFESIQAFVTGSLPSAGMAGLGLVAGFRRR